MIVIYPSSSKRLARMMDQLGENTEITDFNPGTIARSFLDIFNEEQEECYTTLDRYISLAFLSYSSGKFLDLIGAILDCKRLTGETDDNYRYRIGKHVYVTAGANETAIRLECLLVNGVKNVVMRPYTYGLGSFTVFVITDDKITPASVLKEVQKVLDSKKAHGVRGVAARPILVTIDLAIQLFMRPTVSATEASSLIYSARTAVKQYMDNIQMGETFSANIALSKATEVSSNIIHGEVAEIKINGKATHLASYKANWDEKIVVGNLVVK